MYSIGSMYGIFMYILPTNVGQYTIHWSCVCGNVHDIFEHHKIVRQFYRDTFCTTKIRLNEGAIWDFSWMAMRIPWDDCNEQRIKQPTCMTHRYRNIQLITPGLKTSNLCLAYAISGLIESKLSLGTLMLTVAACQEVCKEGDFQSFDCCSQVACLEPFWELQRIHVYIMYIHIKYIIR